MYFIQSSKRIETVIFRGSGNWWIEMAVWGDGRAEITTSNECIYGSKII